MSYITDKDLAREFDKSVEWVQDQCREKKWPHLKVGSSYRFTEAEVAAIEEICRVQAAAPTTADEWGLAPGRRTA